MQQRREVRLTVAKTTHDAGPSSETLGRLFIRVDEKELLVPASPGNLFVMCKLDKPQSNQAELEPALVVSTKAAGGGQE